MCSCYKSLKRGYGEELEKKEDYVEYLRGGGGRHGGGGGTSRRRRASWRSRTPRTPRR